MAQTAPIEVFVSQPGELLEMTATFTSLSGVYINVNGVPIYFHPDCKKLSYIFIQILRSSHILIQIVRSKVS